MRFRIHKESLTGSNEHTQTIPASLRAELVSSGLLLSEDWILSIPRYDTSSDMSPWLRVQLTEFVLPPLLERGHYDSELRTLAGHPPSLHATLSAVAARARRIRPSKSYHLGIYRLLTEVSKIWEYGAVRCLEHPSDWDRHDFDDLVGRLCRGGWPIALDIDARIDALIETATVDELTALLTPHGHHKDYVGRSLPRALMRKLGTNLSSLELRAFAPKLWRATAIRSQRPIPPQAKRSIGFYSQAFQAINDLHIDAGEYGFKTLPIANAGALARKLAAPRGRTQNLGPDQIGALLQSAIEWVYGCGPHLVKLVQELCLVCRNFNQQSDESDLFECLQLKLVASDERHAVERHIGASLCLSRPRRRSEALTVMAVIEGFLTACFLLLALTNARRKDEVIHPKYGLRSNSVSVIDVDFQIYQAHFYIEKTVHDYVPFYVNRMTHDVVQLMGALRSVLREGQADSRDDAAMGVPLFRVTGFNRQGVTGERPFDYSAIGARRWVQRSMGRGTPVRAHMLRRAYALLFYYQYENGTLQALRHQLVHLDLTQTAIYVTDAEGTAYGKRLRELYPNRLHERLGANQADLKNLSKEMEDVGYEKMVTFVAAVIEGTRFSGGYERLVRRLHQRLSRVARYDALDAHAQAQALSQLLKKRGHILRPFPHGECFSGSARDQWKAKCQTDGQAQHHRAAPLTCSRCPFHVVSVGYLDNLKAELVELEQEWRELDDHTLQAKKLRQDIEDMRAVASLHEARLQASCQAGKNSE